jgi:hypothetical protein
VVPKAVFEDGDVFLFGFYGHAWLLFLELSSPKFTVSLYSPQPDEAEGTDRTAALPTSHQCPGPHLHTSSLRFVKGVEIKTHPGLR